MRAIVCVEPGRLALEHRPDPAREEGEVLVAIRRIGICGTDFHIYGGKHPFLQYPRVMGHELSAEVIEAPAGSGFRPGQLVVVNPYLSCGTCIACRSGKPNCCTRIAVLGVHRDGGMCEYLSIPVQNLYDAGALTPDAAASVEFLAIGAHAVARSGLRPGARVLVIGAGPIGLGTSLFATIGGGEVTVLDREAERLAFAVDHGIASKALVADERVTERISEVAGGDGFDLVFDATGNRASMEAALTHVAHGGALVYVSVVNEPITFSDPEFHRREAMLIGSRNALRSDFETVMAAIDGGRVPIRKIITHRTALEETVDNLPRWSREKTGLVKAMIAIG